MTPMGFRCPKCGKISLQVSIEHEYYLLPNDEIEEECRNIIFMSCGHIIFDDDKIVGNQNLLSFAKSCKVFDE